MMPAPITEVAKRQVFLIDDHAVVREGLRRLLEDQGDLTVCGEAESARKAFGQIDVTRPDLIIVDISLPGANGIELIKDLKVRYTRISMIVLSMHDEALYAERALRAGARGYVMKRAATEQLMAAIRTVLRDEIYLSQDLSSQLLKSMISGKERPAHALECLSDRELEILRLIGQGYTTREVSAHLGISVKTVESHRGNIRGKLKLSSGAELMRFAIAHREEKF